MTISNEMLGAAKIKVLGVGGGGCNAITRMYKQRIVGVEYLALNTDAQSLLSMEIPDSIRIGEKLTKGQGVGGDPKKGGERRKGQKTIKVKTKAENMIKLKDLVKENTVSMGKVYSNPYANSFKSPKQIQEQDEPEHFGGGENIDILGFQTEHFDICKSAVILYNKLKEQDLNDTAKELVIDSAKDLDHIFEMEKQVVKGEKIDHDAIEHAVELTNIISYKLGRVGELINDDFERDTNFIKLHVMEIINRSK